MRGVYVFGFLDLVGLGGVGYWSVFDVDLGRGFFWEWSGC